jgi:hypothetical protein
MRQTPLRLRKRREPTMIPEVEMVVEDPRRRGRRTLYAGLILLLVLAALALAG